MSSAIRVLVVDDELSLLDLSKQFLELDQAISVDTAPSASEALGAIKTHEYDAIVSDYQMPGKDGIQLLKEIRKKGNNIPFILFTGKGREEVAIEALNAGADFYLQKGGQSAPQFAELKNMVKQAYAMKEGNKRIEELARIVDSASDAIIGKDLNGTITSWNKGAERIYGYTDDEMIGQSISLLTALDSAGEIKEILAKISHGELISNYETTRQTKSGNKINVLLTISPIFNGKGRIVGASTIASDITARKLSEEALQEREERLQTYMDSAPEGIFVVDELGNYKDVNEMACTILKYSREELLRLNIAGITDKSVIQDAMGGFQRLREKGSMTQETILVRKDGIGVPIFLNAVELPNKRYMAFCTDISKRKQSDTYREAGRDILKALNRAGALQDSLDDVLTILKRLTEVDAIGIRLQSGDDFPYYSQQGFSKDFLIKESSLINPSLGRDICKDSSGKALLECTCGLVIEGRTDPHSPLFTPGGSFWTNDSFPLLELPANQDPRNNPRNTCIHAGYASFALIPIRAKGQIIGLIQLNSRAKGHFNLDLITSLEVIGENIGEALLRKQAEHILRENEEKFMTMFNSANDSIYILGLDGRILEVNKVGCDWLGYTKQEMLQKNIKDINLEAYAIQVPTRIKVVMDKGFSVFETEWATKSGQIIPVEISARRINYGGQSAILSVARNITERMRVEHALRKSEEQYRKAQQMGHVGHWTFDPVSQEFSGSPEALRIYGFPADTRVAFADIVNCISKRDVDRVMPALFSLVKNGTEFHEEFEICPRNTSEIRVIWSMAEMQKDEHGNPFVNGILQDITETKHAEEALRQSEEIFRNFMEYSPNYVFFKDENIRSLRLSKNFETMLGKPIAELLGKNMNEIFPSELAKKMTADDIRTLNGGEKVTVEEELNGRSYSTVKFPILIEGKPRYLAGYSTDITERKQADERLNQSEEKFRKLTEESAVGIYVIQDSKLTYVNPSFANIYGYHVEEMIGKLGPRDIVHPDDIQLVTKRLQNRLSGKTEEDWITYKSIKKDGSTIFTDVYSINMDYQGKPAVLGTIIDVTEKKQAEEALRRSEEKYRQLVESAVDAIFTIDSKMSVNWANEYAHKLFGYSKSDLPVPLRKLVPIRYWPATMKLFREGLKGKIVTEPFELEVIAKGGKRIPVSYKGTLLHDENDNVISVLGVIREIRRSKMLQATPLETEEDDRQTN